MKSFDTEFKKYAHKIRLKAEERRELRERVLVYMEYHPLPKKQEKLVAKKELESESFTILHFNTFYTRIVGGVFALLIIVGIPLVAERSVPGDVLYFIKTGINEEIQTQLADSPYKKVINETKLIERRIAEARLLASEGKLTQETSAAIAENVKGHADAVQSGIAELRTSNADEAAIAEIAFDSALQVQSAVLDTNDERDTDSSTSGILDAVNSVRQEVNAKRGTSTPSFEGLSARVEQETTRAYEFFETIKISATPEEIADIDRRLSDSNRKIAGVKEAYEQGTEGALNDLANALGLIQKLIVFMTDINIRQTVTLESLVPVELTPEERMANAQEIIQSLQEEMNIISTKLEQVTDEGVHEKVSQGIVQINVLIQGATTSLSIQPVDIGSVEGNLKEAQAFTGDLKKLLADIVLDENLPQDGTDGDGMPVLDDTATSTATTTSEIPAFEDGTVTKPL